MQVFIQTLVNGLVTGCLYALIALGYTMVYGVLKLLNFAHGDVYMVGAYIGYFVIQWFGGPNHLAIPVPLLIVFMLVIAGLGTGVCGLDASLDFAFRQGPAEETRAVLHQELTGAGVIRLSRIRGTAWHRSGPLLFGQDLVGYGPG